jgi:hypothetical protein
MEAIELTKVQYRGAKVEPAVLSILRGLPCDYPTVQYIIRFSATILI